MRRNSLKHNILFVSVISAFILYGSTNGNHVVNESINIKNTNHINNYIGSDANVLKELRKQYIIVKTDEKPEPMEFIVTAYDLSFNSCQKSRGSKGYGITSSGYDLRGHTIDSARVISTDPSIIPIGSKVRLTFKEDKYKKYDNIYTALDKGGLIKNQRIDLFVGDNIWSKNKIKDFGVTQAYVEIIKD